MPKQPVPNNFVEFCFMMRCYYEVLQVTDTATNDELKKAYRKLALKCHPDKNPGREKEANEEFKEVCQAYSTLTDPQERAFYDRNKESILRGAGNKDGGSAEELDVFKYFSTNCYPGGYTDASDGFYTVYRNLFYELSMKDMKYMTEEEPEIPTFGDGGSDLEDVAVFYGYWSSYCTSMPFAWADQIDVRQAPCRWVEKKIDRENRKYRDQEKKQFNERIRNLVLFVKKRDPRWKERVRLLEQRSAEAAARREQHQERRREERQRQLEEEMQDESLAAAKREYLQQLRAMESQMRESGDDSMTHSSANYDSSGDSQANESQGEEDEEEDDLICIACVKMFSSERTMELHMNTKKHKMKVAQMLREEQAEGDEEGEEDVLPHADLPGEDMLDCTNEAKVDATEFEDDADSYTPRTTQSKKEKKRKKLEKKLQKGRSNQVNASDGSSVQPDNAVEETLATKVNDLKIDVTDRTDPGNDPNMCSKNCNLTTTSRLDSSPSSVNEATESKAEKDQPKINTHPKKPLQKKTTKAAAPVIVSADDNTDSVEAVCQICQSRFPSKNKLFQHIKATGHAVLKEGVSGKKGKGKRK